MNSLKKLLKEFALVQDIINTILGIALIILLIFVFINPTNRYLLLAAFSIGGLMNVVNGLKLLRDPKKKSMGMSCIFLGIIVIFIGFIIV